MTEKKKGRANSVGRNDHQQFIPLPYRMLHSAAWRSLSGPAVKVFLELRSRFNGRNNGDLSLAHGQGAEILEMSSTTMGRAFKELEAKGFIRMTSLGYFTGGKASTYEVTDCPYRDNLATQTWQKWRPPKKPKKQKPDTETGEKGRKKGWIRNTEKQKPDTETGQKQKS